MKKIIVHIKSEAVECYSQYPFGGELANYVNRKLEYLQNTINNIKYSRDCIRPNVYTYISEEINAFAAKISDTTYVIAISTAIFSNLNQELSSYLCHSDIRAHFYGKHLNIKKHVERILNYILLFIVLHENYHILNGHLDTYFPSENLMFESGAKFESKNQILQILELDADYCAVRSLVYLLDEKYHFEDWADREFLLAGFSLYYIFLIFQEKNYENIQSIGDYLNDFTHPPASVRIVHASSLLLRYGTNLFSNKEKLLSVVYELVDLCIYFDRIYYDSDTVEMTLIDYGYTPKGTEYLQSLYDKWKYVRKKLETYAQIELREVESLNSNQNYFLNNQGEFVKALNMEKRMELFWKNLLRL